MARLKLLVALLSMVVCATGECKCLVSEVRRHDESESCMCGEKRVRVAKPNFGLVLSAADQCRVVGADMKRESRDTEWARSGRVCCAAYCKQPMSSANLLLPMHSPCCWLSSVPGARGVLLPLHAGMLNLPNTPSAYLSWLTRSVRAALSLLISSP